MEVSSSSSSTTASSLSSQSSSSSSSTSSKSVSSSSSSSSITVSFSSSSTSSVTNSASSSSSSTSSQSSNSSSSSSTSTSSSLSTSSSSLNKYPILTHALAFPPVRQRATIRQVLTVGTTWRWEGRFEKNGEPWNLAGAVCTLEFTYPDGTEDSFEMRIAYPSLGIAWYDNTVDDLDQSGILTVLFAITVGGVTQRSLPIVYTVLPAS